MPWCTTLKNEVLDQLFGGSDYSEPGTWYIGLATSVAADGTITGEPSGSNYARVTVTNNDANWNAAASGATSNETAITFNTASGDWGALDTVFLSASSSGGTALAYGALDTEIHPTTNYQPYFAAGDLDISLS